MRAWLNKKQSGSTGVIFKNRGTESSRLEQLSDGVFALAITLLLVSLETPKSGDELILFAKDFLAFALSTIVLMILWYIHYLYFLRYGLSDKTTILINSWLLVVVLFFVYPLKFIISFMLNYLKFTFLMVFNFNYDREVFIKLVTEVNSWDNMPFIMMIYSAGYLALMLSFALFYRHAYVKREELSLSSAEAERTYFSMIIYYIQCGVAGFSVLIALAAMFTPVSWLALMAGMVYFFIGPFIYLFGRRYRINKKKQEVQTEKSHS